MNIKLDNRENGLIKELSNNNVSNIVIEQLPLGDIIIEKNNEEIIIIERKSLNDLISSIKDGRYKEQALRLSNTNIPNHNIIYLIEGNLNSFSPPKNMSKETLYSSFVSLMYFQGFSVFRTNDIKESAKYIINLSNKIGKESKNPYYNINNNINNNNNIPYTNVIKKVKKDNINTGNFGQIILCQIPGISSTTAMAIMKEYSSFPDFLKRLQENPDCLNDVVYESNGKTRKISKSCIANIKIFLLF